MTPTPKRNNEARRKSLTLHEIADLVEGEIVGNRDVTITGAAGIKEARQGDITFLSNARYLSFLSQTQASAVITAEDVVSPDKPLVRTPNPSEAFTKIISYFTPALSKEPEPGVHPSAVVDPTAKIGREISIGPHVVIESDAVIGDRAVIGANTFIGFGASIGRGVRIYPNVTIRERTMIGDRVIVHSGAVIGSDGFGYEIGGDEPLKIPQTGYVQIEEDVEIGANVTIDRGRFDKTWIQKGAKIDNLVQIAHNVIVGSNSIIVAQAGLSGSAELGRNVMIAGQAGIVGHVKLGDRVVVGASAGVTKSVPPDTVVLGSPARPIQEQKRIFALIARLPELFKDVLELKKRFEKK